MDEEAKESDQEEHNSEGGVVGSSPNAEFEHAPGHEAVVHVEGDEDQENDAACSACVLVDSLVVSLVNFVVARLIFLHYLKFIRDFLILFFKLSDEFGQTFVIVAHNEK